MSDVNDLGQPTNERVGKALCDAFCDTCNAILCDGCPVFRFAERAAELALLRAECAIKDAAVKRLDTVNAELRRRLELAEAKENEE